MRKTLALVSALGLLATVYACSNQCSSGAVCGDYNTVGPSGTPTATPLPSPGSTPDPCRTEAIRVSFKGGAQLASIALGASEQLDATPMNSSGPVPDGCNVAREPFWTLLTPTTCQVIGGGYNPFLKGLRVGLCLVMVMVSNVISPFFSVDVR